ncbi:MAG: phosphoglucosamine mutase [Burkholderiales bacterium]|nr:phosphoglucosamine mutase [Burkholderiales bacterium]
MSRKYFGTDGIRGLVGEPPITPDFMVRLGYAAGEVLAHRAQLPPGLRPAVLIGKDTRISGYMLEASLEAGFAAAGVDVMLSGPMPTPAVAYLTRALRLQAGVVISASHNAYPDNGIKFFSGDGNKLADAVEMEIEAQLEQPMRCCASAQLGKARRIDDAAGRYIEFCKSTFPNRLHLRGLKIVVDCANGAAYHIAPHVFHELGADVVAIGVEPDGLNINDKVGATSPQALQLAVQQHKADLGIALDGDGDRLVMVDDRGLSYDGDQLLYVIARMRAGQGAVPGVVGTLMSNLALQRALEEAGIAFARARVGDRYVLEVLQEKGWQLGGENSGHIICLDKHTTGDALISALQVLRAVRESGRTLSELSRGLTLYPQKLVNVRVGKGFNWESSAAVGKAKQTAESELGKAGRVLLRPSGTEPVLRVMVEGEDGAKVESLAAMLAESVRAAAQA